MDQLTDRELMVAAYQLSTQIQNLTRQLNAVQNEIDKRVKETIDGQTKKDE